MRDMDPVTVQLAGALRRAAAAQQEGPGAARAGAAFAASDDVLTQRTYFLPTLAAYVAGLGLAFAANAVTHMGQPALLYLVRAHPPLRGLCGACGGPAPCLVTLKPNP
jgi:hypothetical protein